MIKKILRWVLTLGMIFIGGQHFINPKMFIAIVPDYLPAHEALVYISGFFEILGGVGLAIPFLRNAAAWGLIALYIAVFPANINMAVNHMVLPTGEGTPLPEWALWVRLPIQIVLIFWAYAYTNKKEKRK
jgi:uncharacterized membrane protein